MKPIVAFAALIIWTCGCSAQGIPTAYNIRVSVSYVRLDASLDPADMRQPPSYESLPIPEYPYEAKRAGLSGVTKIRFLIKKDGLVYDPKVSSTSKFDLLDQAAISAVKGWRFHSFRQEIYGGIANRYSHPITVEATVTYELPDE